MKNAKSRFVAVASAAALVLGFAGSVSAQEGHAQHGAASPASPQQHSGSGHEMMESMQDMHQKMSSMKMTGDHDHDFAMMMRSHHQAGLEMARAELKNGKDAQMKKMAQKVINDQTKEIKKLDDWLAKHQASGK